MSDIESFVSNLASFLWGIPLLIVLIGGGIFLLIYSRLIQFKYFFHAIDILRGKFDNKDDIVVLTRIKMAVSPLNWCS